MSCCCGSSSSPQNHGMVWEAFKEPQFRGLFTPLMAHRATGGAFMDSEDIP